jgi:hypothetical protein
MNFISFLVKLSVVIVFLFSKGGLRANEDKIQKKICYKQEDPWINFRVWVVPCGSSEFFPESLKLMSSMMKKFSHVFFDVDEKDFEENNWFAKVYSKAYLTFTKETTKKLFTREELFSVLFPRFEIFVLLKARHIKFLDEFTCEDDVEWVN